MKIIFWGSDDFAARNLESLIGSSHEVLACVTQPDKPKGRFLHLAAPETKKAALKNRVDVLQPKSLDDKVFLERIKSNHIMRIAVFRRAHFNAAHRLHNPRWSAEKNKEFFGDKNVNETFLNSSFTFFTAFHILLSSKYLF